MFSQFLIFLVRLYQRYLSPDHSFWARALNRPLYCKYIPTCSEYMVESIEKRGVVRGILKGIWRVLRCNPWSHGGYDPVETETSEKLDLCIQNSVSSFTVASATPHSGTHSSHKFLRFGKVSEKGK
ncbi:TPA: membrane protein insertion efficiency factor YidD [Candidatus Gracilibacteria bacterium]|nr:membrane protein insertion efficiency factor YidD [Candidatus Gracilibacteria bacterium]